MMTCGNTDLINGLEYFSKTHDESTIESLIYERKNEYYPQLQPKSVFDDIDKIESLYKGRTLRFGHPDEHHVYLFHLNKLYKPLIPDRTIEILLYQKKNERRKRC